MNALWRAKSAITSATKGWLCVWLLLVLWTMTSLRAKGHASFTNLLSMLLIWVVSTGIVTMTTTILLMVPYVCLRGVDILLHKPWLIYFESGALAIFATLVLTHFVKPTAETFSATLKPFLVFALATSLTSSAFYIKKLRAMSKQQVTSGSD